MKKFEGASSNVVGKICTPMVGIGLTDLPKIGGPVASLHLVDHSVLGGK